MGCWAKTNTVKLNRDECEVPCFALGKCPAPAKDRPGVEIHSHVCSQSTYMYWAYRVEDAVWILRGSPI